MELNQIKHGLMELEQTKKDYCHILQDQHRNSPSTLLQFEHIHSQYHIALDSALKHIKSNLNEFQTTIKNMIDEEKNGSQV